MFAEFLGALCLFLVIYSCSVHKTPNEGARELVFSIGEDFRALKREVEEELSDPGLPSGGTGAVPEQLDTAPREARQ